MRPILKIDDLSFMLKLGVPAAERKVPQRVTISISLAFHQPIKGMHTDLIHHTFCYQKLEDLLRAELNDRSFHLLEHLGYTCFQLIQAELPAHVDFKLQVTKYLSEERGSRSFVLASVEDATWL